MLFKRIKIQNIRSYDNADMVIPQGSVLLSGDIGSGKTSILLAIEFALFGLQPGQKGTSLLKNGRDEGRVELEFELDGQNIIITRTLKRKKTVGQEETYITIDGKTEEKAITDMKNQVLQLLNYPLEFAKKTNLLYRFTVYTPQEEMKQIILENPEIRLNTLRHVFGIDKYKRIKENSTILTARLRELSRLKQGQILDLDLFKTRMNEKKESLILIQEQIPEIEKKLSEILVLKIKKETEIKEIEGKIDEKNKIENEVEKLNILLLTKREQIVKIDKDIELIRKRLEQVSKEFNQEELDKTIIKLSDKKKSYEKTNREIIELSAKISSFLSKKTELEKLKEAILNLKVCPTCFQEVTVTHKHGIFEQTEKEIQSIATDKINTDNEKQKKEILIKQINSEILDLEKFKSSLEAIKIRIQTIQEDSKKLDDFERQKISLNQDIELLTGQAYRLKEGISELKKYDLIMQAKKKELEVVILEERQIDIKKAEIIKEIELGNREIARMEKEISEKEKIKDELLYIVELENWVSSQFLELISFIEKNVMLRLREEFSKLFNEWFSILVPDTFNVRLDEEFTPIIEQQDYELDYGYLSGGERTAIALAYRLALNQTINSLLSEIKTKGIVILDEPTDGFSQQQLDKMRDVLQQLKVNQLIIVSHDQKMEGFVENIVRLKKDHGVTSLIA
ncbi:AAA family ATPase [Candidatus Pacearchaeota archaeon]|nr:AAA family ATPase [Candidatus Pacearchaeota archaeon]